MDRRNGTAAKFVSRRETSFTFAKRKHHLCEAQASLRSNIICPQGQTSLPFCHRDSPTVILSWDCALGLRFYQTCRGAPCASVLKIFPFYAAVIFCCGRFVNRSYRKMEMSCVDWSFCDGRLFVDAQCAPLQICANTATIFELFLKSIDKIFKLWYNTYATQTEY